MFFLGILQYLHVCMNVQVHGAYSSTLRHSDTPLPLHPTEGIEKVKSGELLSRHKHLSRVHIIQLQVSITTMILS